MVTSFIQFRQPAEVGARCALPRAGGYVQSRNGAATTLGLERGFQDLGPVCGGHLEIAAQPDVDAGFPVRRSGKPLFSVRIHGFWQLLLWDGFNLPAASGQWHCKTDKECAAGFAEGICSTRRRRLGHQWKRRLGAARRVWYVLELAHARQYSGGIPRQSAWTYHAHFFRCEY